MAVWVATTGSKIPEDAIRAGYETDGRPLFIARAKIHGIMTSGKCGFHLPGAHIPYGRKEEIINQYEVLVLPLRKPGFLDWQKACLRPLKKEAVFDNCAYISYCGAEFSYKDYEALCTKHFE
ncbi:uncharacterized protein LOC134228970 [Saccostrea cucullata]|uniref:uncharacterized protein LOC134228970 n=1 Tax=Saccostrea cuccullata TaxID=36930 RepID=UPI002ED1A402